MKTYFDISSDRKILECSDMFYKNPTLHPARNKPSFHDFVYMIKGEWDFRVDGQVYNVIPGDVFILPAGTEYKGVNGCSAGTRTIFIHTSSLPSDRPEGETEDNSISDSILLGRVIHCHSEPAIRSLFIEIAKFFISDIPQKEAIMLALWKALISMLSVCPENDMVHRKDFIAKALELMQNHPDVFYKEYEMADMLGISSKTLRAGFVKRFNKTFYRYQLDGKLNLALSMLLQDPSAKMYEMSHNLGFNDEFHFSKLFKNKFGVSPSEYRKKGM